MASNPTEHGPLISAPSGDTLFTARPRRNTKVGLDVLLTKASIDFQNLTSERDDPLLKQNLESLRMPYTGSGVIPSALAMHKARAKEHFKHEEIPTARLREIGESDHGAHALLAQPPSTERDQRVSHCLESSRTRRLVISFHGIGSTTGGSACTGGFALQLQHRCLASRHDAFALVHFSCARSCSPSSSAILQIRSAFSQM